MAGHARESGVRSLQLALDVLETVAFSGEELGVTQIADRVHVTKGSVHRHLLTLVERGYLAQNSATARYAIGPKSRLLARLAPDADLVETAEGSMRQLRDALGHTVVLSAMTPAGALVMSTIASKSPIEIGVRPGSELSFHASAQGKVLLAFAPRPVQERVLAKPLPALTAKTVVDRERRRIVPDHEARLRRSVRAGAAGHQRDRSADLQPDRRMRRLGRHCRVHPVPAGSGGSRYSRRSQALRGRDIEKTRIRTGRDRRPHACLSSFTAEGRIEQAGTTSILCSWPAALTVLRDWVAKA